MDLRSHFKILSLIFILAGCTTTLRHSDEEFRYTHHKISQSCTWPLMHACKGIGASFSPSLYPISLDSAGEQSPLAKEVQQGLEISLEEFVSPEKSTKAFDANLAASRVLAFLVRADNKGNKHYKLRYNQVQALLSGQPLAPLYGYEAAQHGAARGYVWRALASTVVTGPAAIYFWPAFITLSASHTKSTNRMIEQHFESLELRDTLLKPEGKTAGFVFFRLPERTKKIENLEIHVIAETEEAEDQKGQEFKYKLSLPTLDLSNQIPSQ